MGRSWRSTQEGCGDNKGSFTRLVPRVDHQPLLRCGGLLPELYWQVTSQRVAHVSVRQPRQHSQLALPKAVWWLRIGDLGWDARTLKYLIAFAIGICASSSPTLCFAQAKDTACPEMEDIDPDNHGTIDLVAAQKAGTALIHENNPEFLKVVEQRFKAADADNDGTIDCNELSSPAGHSLLRVTTRGGTVRSHIHRQQTPPTR